MFNRIFDYMINMFKSAMLHYKPASECIRGGFFASLGLRDDKSDDKTDACLRIYQVFG